MKIEKVIDAALKEAIDDPSVPLNTTEAKKLRPALVEAVNKSFADAAPLGMFSKLIAAVAGNIVAIALAWLAVQVPSVAECNLVDAVQNCTILGSISQAQLTAALMAAFNTAFVYYFPPNRPPA